MSDPTSPSFLSLTLPTNEHGENSFLPSSVRHVDGTPAPDPVDPTWQATDFSVRSLLYYVVSPQIMRCVLTPSASAYEIWIKIENQFRDNKTSRALALEADFHNLAQGDLSVDDYAECLKFYADGLANLGHAVSDPTLVLTLLRGLNAPLRSMGSIIKTCDPLPSFSEAYSLLSLEEVDL